MLRKAHLVRPRLRSRFSSSGRTWILNEMTILPIIFRSVFHRQFAADTSGVFRDCTAPDTKGAIAASPTERRLRWHLGYQNLPIMNIRDSQRNRLPCIPPSTLPARPVPFEVRGQRRFLCPEQFPAAAAISRLGGLGAKRQIAQLRESMRSRERSTTRVYCPFAATDHDLPLMSVNDSENHSNCWFPSFR
jgi:hypothetical protein